MSKDLKKYATATITPTMEAFAEWLQKETGYAVDPRTVALAGSLRSDFQKSEAWKSDSRNYLANVEARREQKAKDALARAEASAAKAAERLQAAKDKAEAAVAAATAASESATAKATTARATTKTAKAA